MEEFVHPCEKNWLAEDIEFQILLPKNSAFSVRSSYVKTRQHVYFFSQGKRNTRLDFLIDVLHAITLKFLLLFRLGFFDRKSCSQTNQGAISFHGFEGQGLNQIGKKKWKK